LFLTARAAKVPMPATTVAAIYMLFMGTATWVLPLFPGQPMLAPIYNPVTHMVPPPFPMLLVLAAPAIDGAMKLFGRGRGWWRDALTVVVGGTGFAAWFGVAQWNFSKFLLSPEANNWIFVCNRYWPFDTPQENWRLQFWRVDTDPVNLKAMLWALGLALVSSALGLALGNWMARVKR